LQRQSARVADKFMSLTTGILPRSQATRLLKKLETFTASSSAREVMDLCSDPSSITM
jgi:hypothetical protein